MLKNPWVLAMLVLAFLAACWFQLRATIVAVVFPPPPPAVTPENFNRLYNGITLEEAHELLGPPSAVEGGRIDMWGTDEFSIELHSTNHIVRRGNLSLRNGQTSKLPTLAERYLLCWEYVGFYALFVLIGALSTLSTVFFLRRGRVTARPA